MQLPILLFFFQHRYFYQKGTTVLLLGLQPKESWCAHRKSFHSKQALYSYTPQINVQTNKKSWSFLINSVPFTINTCFYYSGHNEWPLYVQVVLAILYMVCYLKYCRPQKCILSNARTLFLFFGWLLWKCVVDADKRCSTAF